MTDDNGKLVTSDAPQEQVSPMMTVNEIDALPKGDRSFVKELVENEFYYRRQLFDKMKDPRRDIYEDCGYVRTEDLTPEKYLDMYRRFSIATRVVDLPVDESWRSQPVVSDDKDPDNETPFKLAWKQLDKDLRTGETWFKDAEGSPIYSHLRRVDRQSRIGQYGIMLLELDDIVDDKEGEGKTWADPAPGFEGFDDLGQFTVNAEGENELKDSELSLIGLRTFDQVHAEVHQWFEDETTPMFGKPFMYKILLGNQEETTTKNATKGIQARQVDVHWSRVIHVADGLMNGEYLGTPACRPVNNDLMDLQKLYAASGEGYWRSAFPGLSFESHPQLGGKVQMDSQGIKQQMQRYQHTLQRYLSTVGGTIKTLSGQVTDLTAHVERRIESICIYLGCPVRIFKGSERGELASSQDKDSWDERMMLRQLHYITPNIIVPFTDRCIQLGLLPEPEEDGYGVEWPNLTQLSAETKASVAKTRTETMALYVSGEVDSLIAPSDFLVKEMDYSEEDAEQVLEDAVDHVNAANPEEDDIVEAGQKVKQPPPMMLDEEGNPVAPPDEDNPFSSGKDKKKEGKKAGDVGEPKPRRSVAIMN